MSVALQDEASADRISRTVEKTQIFEPGIGTRRGIYDARGRDSVWVDSRFIPHHGHTAKLLPRRHEWFLGERRTRQPRLDSRHDGQLDRVFLYDGYPG